MWNSTPHARYFAAMVAAVAAFALVLQYVLLMRATLDTVGPFFATVRFFSYFTILSNLLVMLVSSTAAFAPESSPGRWLAQPVMRGGVALYIGVTMGIYAVVLHRLWEPQGAQWWADTGLHYAVPTLYLLWWLVAVPHGALRWSDLLRWLLFPLFYVCWVFLRGAFVHEYPYPFIDLNAHDLATVLRNCAGVIAAFLVLGSVLVLVDRWRGRTGQPAVAT
ncbi:Pr6Pr family membrane protein [Lysobacter tyrosinilyticus]